MSLQVTIADPAEYHLAVARRITNARHQAALAIAEVAEAHVRKVGANAEALAALPESSWRKLEALAGRARKSSPETRAEVIRIVSERLAADVAAA